MSTAHVTKPAKVTATAICWAMSRKRSGITPVFIQPADSNSEIGLQR